MYGRGATLASSRVLNKTIMQSFKLAVQLHCLPLLRGLFETLHPLWS
jgi:hypothetical protein